MTIDIRRRGLLQVGSALALAAVLPRCTTVNNNGDGAGISPYPALLTDIPRSNYGFATTCDEVAAGYDLAGKTVLITGCNSGLGYASMRTLVAHGAHVLGTARTRAKAEEACASVSAGMSMAQFSGKATPLVCELTDMESVTACADAVDQLLENYNKPLDVLMCNAGIMALPKLEQVDVLVGGKHVMLEKQFVVNHLGHYLLTRRLLPQVEAAAAGRIVILSSMGYTLAPEEGIQFDNLSGAENYKPFKAYGQSKLSNALFSNELSRRYADTPLTSNAVHPGMVNTNLGRYISGKAKDPDAPLRKGFKTPDQGAATQVYCAIDKRLNGVSGYYFEDCNPSVMKGENANSSKLAAKLWNVSQDLVSPYL
ncbi:MAG: SDR family NAD(P)-dependent oxidoreductase [Gammaproteobacteria bacterium]|nr:SDR family NAD(P)-dependent oxidoreductase [Gammaproteobacteria bacterium]MCP4090808.1 SDR family NAD(P)-dependent oxidoreductase [Gammaproteobacteria bacterium]MCP4277235.1 SDR family NAD(P)-dependent oxidoreductase [Gammaproteobacteria bacterium]MCP4832857.1 SDR family NAD(P)-dependent oxidoreductase [Gammaproteobacteria bacterium]MCP4928956.1 SDR family NAD(P)-dependent oxidoreductase [Gammaproteobacteria bacterium]